MKNGGKKRKILSREELHEQDVKTRYAKLVNKAAKLLRREAKVCKTFECQKIIRKIKAIGNSSVNDEDDGKAKVKTKIQNLEEKLKVTKRLELDEVVNVSLTRLGLDYTKVTQKKLKDKEKADIKQKDDLSDCRQDQRTLDESNEEYQSTLIESILKHKKMVSAIEDVNKSSTEYHLWLAREEEWLSSDRKKSSKKKNKKINPTITQKSFDVSAHIANSGLFIDSLAGRDDDNDDDDNNVDADISEKYSGFGQDEEGNDDDYAYEMYTDETPKRKKNRMGQRERKARAMALEAKEQGKHYDPSSIKKWYQLKPKNPKKEMKGTDNDKKDQLASGLDASKKVDVSEVVTMGTTWKDEGKAHPSWAARQVQKSKSGSGIGNIEFKGKKITFD